MYTFNAATEQLEAVSGLSADATDDGWHLKWNAVKNAAWYRVKVGDIEKKADTNEINIAGSELTDGKAYNITVSACPKDLWRRSVPHSRPFAAKTLQSLRAL